MKIGGMVSIMVKVVSSLPIMFSSTTKCFSNGFVGSDRFKSVLFSLYSLAGLQVFVRAQCLLLSLTCSGDVHP
jgi:hypothetical protein